MTALFTSGDVTGGGSGAGAYTTITDGADTLTIAGVNLAAKTTSHGTTNYTYAGDFKVA